jgi:uroporphyrinogen-III synthase
MNRILSTRKLLSSQRQFLLNAGLSVVESDFIKIENKTFGLKDINDNLIFSSQNAVQSVLRNPRSENLKDRNVFCVGLKTKALLEQNGYDVIAHAGYASDLAEIITLIYRSEPFTFFSGNLRRDVLPEALRSAGVNFNEIQVYKTSLTPQKINSAFDGILFFSPSAVDSYLQNNKIKSEICFAIGATTAEALSKHAKTIIVANQPTVENTIIQCINEYK